MKQSTQKAFYPLTVVLILLLANPIFCMKNSSENFCWQNECKQSLKLVQNQSFSLAEGKKQIVTFSLHDFKNQEKCWDELKETARQLTDSSEIAGVYFFSLPPEKIIRIETLTEDFSQYGKNLIAVYWKDPDSGPMLKRFPNNIMERE